MVYIERGLKITLFQPPAMVRNQEHLPPDQADQGPIQLGQTFPSFKASQLWSCAQLC